jgi:hypothetical protein
METTHISSTTGTGGHDIIVRSKQLVELTGQRLGHVFETRIAHRLTTTSLPLGVVDIKAQRTQKTPCRHTDLRIECVNIAGYKKSDLHRLTYLS